MTLHPDLELGQETFRHRPAGHPGRRFPGAGPFKDVPGVPPVVLEHPHQVGVPGLGRYMGLRALGFSSGSGGS